MKKILIGLDRDDTINVNPDEDYGKQENWRELLEICPTVIEGIKLLNKHECTLVVASNQSGVARKLFPYERQQKINNILASMLEEQGAIIHSWNFCPFYSESRAQEVGLSGHNKWVLKDSDPRLDLRKPKIGMLLKGVQELGLTLGDFDHVAFVGDAITDVEVGLNAGGIGVMIDLGEKNKEHRELLDLNDPKQKLVPNFYQAAKTVLDLFL